MTDSKDTLQLLIIELASKLAGECQRLNVAVSAGLGDTFWKRGASYWVRAFPGPDGGAYLCEVSSEYLPERFDLTKRPDPMPEQKADAARFPAGILRALAVALPRLINQAREKGDKIEAENRRAIETARKAIKE